MDSFSGVRAGEAKDWGNLMTAYRRIGAVRASTDLTWTLNVSKLDCYRHVIDIYTFWTVSWAVTRLSLTLTMTDWRLTVDPLVASIDSIESLPHWSFSVGMEHSGPQCGQVSLYQRCVAHFKQNGAVAKAAVALGDLDNDPNRARASSPSPGSFFIVFL